MYTSTYIHYQSLLKSPSRERSISQDKINNYLTTGTYFLASTIGFIDSDIQTSEKDINNIELQSNTGSGYYEYKSNHHDEEVVELNINSDEIKEIKDQSSTTTEPIEPISIINNCNKIKTHKQSILQYLIIIVFALEILQIFIDINNITNYTNCSLLFMMFVILKI